jgi:hypothetical protein
VGDQGVLDHLLGRLPVSDQALRPGQQAGPVTQVELPEGVGVAAVGNPAQQLLVC